MFPKSEGLNFNFKKIIWAVNAAEDISQYYQQAAEILRYFSSILNEIIIQPVYVFGADQTGLSLEFSSPWIEEYQLNIEKSLNEELKTFKLSKLQPLQVISKPTSSISKAVDATVHFATQCEANLILVSSHGKSDYEQIHPGSFAETLLHRSKIPIMVVGPRSKPTTKLDHILYPTGFGEHSGTVFIEVAKAALQLKAQLTLLHIMPKLKKPFLDLFHKHNTNSQDTQYANSEALRNNEIQKQQQRTQAWVNWAENQGVTVNFKVDTESDSVTDGIIQLSKQTPYNHMIMLEAQTSAIHDILLGSITKSLIRQAFCPIWIFTSPFVEKTILKKHDGFSIRNYG